MIIIKNNKPLNKKLYTLKKVDGKEVFESKENNLKIDCLDNCKIYCWDNCKIKYYYKCKLIEHKTTKPIKLICKDGVIKEIEK